MKKSVLFFIALIISTAESFGQFKVASNGKVSVGTSSSPVSKFAVNHAGSNYFTSYFYGENVAVGILSGGKTDSNSPYWGTGLSVYNSVTSNPGDVGIESSVVSSTPLTAGSAIGIIGEGGNAGSGPNIGTAGRLLGTKNGAGLVGTVDMNPKSGSVAIVRG